MSKSLIIIGLLISFYVHAGSNCTTESSCFRPRITWKWDSNYKLYDVCSRYAKHHWKYRHCRMDAYKLFKQKCKYAKKQKRLTGGELRDKYRIEEKIYCRTFRP